MKQRALPFILYKHFKGVSREFDEFRVNTHLCKQAALLVLVVYYVGEFLYVHVACFRSEKSVLSSRSSVFKRWMNAFIRNYCKSPQQTKHHTHTTSAHQIDSSRAVHRAATFAAALLPAASSV